MMHFRRSRGRFFAGVFAAVVAAALPGCDSSSEKAEYKPLEGNILKRLGQASQEQNHAAEANKAVKSKRK